MCNNVVKLLKWNINQLYIQLLEKGLNVPKANIIMQCHLLGLVSSCNSNSSKLAFHRPLLVVRCQ